MKFQGAGEITVARRNLTTGKPATAFQTFGCVDIFDPKFTVEKGTPHIERCSGLGQTDYQGEKSKSGVVDLSFTDWTIENIAKMLGGEIIEAGSPATTEAEEETLPEGIIAGDAWHLGATGDVTHQAITDLELTDASDVPLVEGDNYTLDPVYGTVKFIDVDGFTQPFKTNAYGYTVKRAVAIFKRTADEYFLRVNSKNVANALSKGIGEFYRAKFDPPSSFPLISDDFATFSMQATLYADQDRSVDDEYGQFGRMIPDLT